MEPLTVTAAIKLSQDAPVPLLESEDTLLGINTFLPGDFFANHIHEHSEETFIGISGELTLWIDRIPQKITPGKVTIVDRNVEHCLRNDTDEPAVIAYFKAPNLPLDRVLIDWKPEKGAES